jgi:nucleoside-diphosphate-sugar epimerase
VLVTGASGFVGSRVVKRLLEQGTPVRVIVREGAELPADGRVEVLRGDFVDPDTARRAVDGVLDVVHCAATAGPELEPVRRVNVDGTRALVEAALEQRVHRFVQISTISVYDRAGRSAIDEDSPLKTSGDPYGWTKAEGDRAVLDAMERGLDGVILRPGAILGDAPTSTWATRIPQMVLEGKVKLRKNGTDTIPFIHVEDLVDAVMLALHSDRAVGRVYDVADEHHTWREYTDEIRRWFDLPELEQVPEAEVTPATYWVGTVSTQRIRRELGFAPARSYRDGMAEAEQAWKERRATTRRD